MDNIIQTRKIEAFDIYGLAYNCPYLLRIDGCPFIRMDKLSFKKKVDWIKGLNDNEIEDILDYHFSCSRKRKTGT